MKVQSTVFCFTSVLLQHHWWPSPKNLASIGNNRPNCRFSLGNLLYFWWIFSNFFWRMAKRTSEPLFLHVSFTVLKEIHHLKKYWSNGNRVLINIVITNVVSGRCTRWHLLLITKSFPWWNHVMHHAKPITILCTWCHPWSPRGYK